MSTTITITIETKRLLEKIKGELSWDDFLRKLTLDLISKEREDNRKLLMELLEEEPKRVKWAREY
ncbi:MAG: hypothetical protein QW638_06010 [Candidatus Bathyarchaeia archaeon]|nr:hypothetical protein [Candidatus Bathyarchaeota archaeon]